MRQPPAVTIHNVAQARAAIAASGPRGVLLLSASNAAAFLGPAWFAAIIGDHRPSAFDCGEDPGHALAAIRHGFTLLILRNPPESLRTLGATLLTTRPDSLDLDDWNLASPRAQRALRDYLNR